MRELLKNPSFYPILYFAAVNLAAFIVMGADKARARRGGRRVPEGTLFLLALIGGAGGGLCGMLVFRHKTRHWYFVVGFPLIFLLQVAAALYLIFWVL